MLTVIRSDSPAGARAGLVEILASGGGTQVPPARDAEVSAAELVPVSVAITSSGGLVCPPGQPAGAPDAPVLVSPFDALARRASARDVGPGAGVLVAHSSADGSTWVSLHVRENAATVTVAAASGDALSSIGDLWSQATALCRTVFGGRGSSVPVHLEITLHFARMRLEEAQWPKALQAVAEWEATRDTS